MRRLILTAAMCAVALTGCYHQSKNYRIEVKGGAQAGGFTYWKQRHATIESGICAAVYGSPKTGFEVDLPLLPGGQPMVGGQLVYEIKPTYAAAEKRAEDNCLTR